MSRNGLRNAGTAILAVGANSRRTSGTQLAGRKEAMKLNYKIGVAVVDSFVLGVCAANVLHGAGTPPTIYLDRNRCQRSGRRLHEGFSSQGASQHQESGGKYLASGFNKAIGLSGSPSPNRVVLIPFADMDAVTSFYAKDHALEADVGNSTSASASWARGHRAEVTTRRRRRKRSRDWLWPPSSGAHD
jgi:uncharacterized protein (DUF1330 family)